MTCPVLAPGVSPIVRELAQAQAAQGVCDRELACHWPSAKDADR